VAEAETDPEVEIVMKPRAASALVRPDSAPLPENGGM
jgi:hypothetical protein